MPHEHGIIAGQCVSQAICHQGLHVVSTWAGCQAVWPPAFDQHMTLLACFPVGFGGNTVVGGLLMHQLRDTSGTESKHCKGRFSEFMIVCSLSGSTVYKTTATGAQVAVSASESQAALSGDTQSSVVGVGLPAFGVDPVFLLGSASYNPSMQAQIGKHAHSCLACELYTATQTICLSHIACTTSHV